MRPWGWEKGKGWCKGERGPKVRGVKEVGKKRKGGITKGWNVGWLEGEVNESNHFVGCYGCAFGCLSSRQYLTSVDLGCRFHLSSYMSVSLNIDLTLGRYTYFSFHHEETRINNGLKDWREVMSHSNVDLFHFPYILSLSISDGKQCWSRKILTDVTSTMLSKLVIQSYSCILYILILVHTDCTYCYSYILIVHFC